LSNCDQLVDALLKAEKREKGFGQCAICMCENSTPLCPPTFIGEENLLREIAIEKMEIQKLTFF
jgi:hypothetical protein